MKNWSRRMDSKYCILLVEDDYALAMGTEYTLKAEGYGIRHAKNLQEARQAVEAAGDGEINLILLDVMLPDGSGFDYLEQLRDEQVEIPVIFLTAVGDEANIVRGLDLGADDYVTKPYRVKELLSRISAVLRREERLRRMAADQRNSDNQVSESIGDEYTFGSHVLNVSQFRLYNNGDMVECTPSEIRLLREFLRNSGIALTRNQLIEKLYDTENSYIDDNTLSVYIKRLRDKLGEDAGYIKTIKGIGYRFSED
ncbi:MAG: response regulator transcription factor [Eubacterium sp.]|nr:response regulator transcription factor [Eubacterium sp.]MBP3266722.1 response regulator transcription factor [Ruminococcus sp.]